MYVKSRRCTLIKQRNLYQIRPHLAPRVSSDQSAAGATRVRSRSIYTSPSRCGHLIDTYAQATELHPAAAAQSTEFPVLGPGMAGRFSFRDHGAESPCPDTTQIYVVFS